MVEEEYVDLMIPNKTEICKKYLTYFQGIFTLINVKNFLHL